MTVESDGYLFCLLWTDDRRVQYGRKIHFGFVGSGQKRHSGCLAELVLYFVGLDGHKKESMKSAKGKERKVQKKIKTKA